MDVSRYIVGLEPGDTIAIPCTTVLCMNKVIGLCLECETSWVRCSCGETNFDCECGQNLEFVDLYLQRRLLALEEAIRKHRKMKGASADNFDQDLYIVYESI